jgi:membrane associated rhomboid family serine protease
MAFPLADDNSDRTTFPVVTVVLIALNVLVFVFLQGMGNNEAFTYAFSTVPEEIWSGEDRVTEDRVIQVQPQGPSGPVVNLKAPGLRPTPIPVYLTLLTSMFMHGSIMHLAGNMWFLWIFGDNIEEDLGHLGYVVFYLVCGLLASLAHVAVNLSGPSALTPSLGASGAISGVMGAYLVLHPHRRVTVLLFRFITQVPGYVAVGLWFLFQVIDSLGLLGGGDKGIAYAAHIGGFIAGAVIAGGFLMVRPPRESAREWREVMQRRRYE